MLESKHLETTERNNDEKIDRKENDLDALIKMLNKMTKIKGIILSYH